MSDSEPEEKVKENFLHSYMDLFKNKAFNPSALLPAPLEIIAKTGFNTYDEPIQTGAPINFLKLEKLNGGRFFQEALSIAKAEAKLEVLGNCKPEVKTIRDNAT